MTEQYVWRNIEDPTDIKRPGEQIGDGPNVYPPIVMKRGTLVADNQKGKPSNRKKFGEADVGSP